MKHGGAFIYPEGTKTEIIEKYEADYPKINEVLQPILLVNKDRALLFTNSNMSTVAVRIQTIVRDKGFDLRLSEISELWVHCTVQSATKTNEGAFDSVKLMEFVSKMDSYSDSDIWDMISPYFPRWKSILHDTSYMTLDELEDSMK